MANHPALVGVGHLCTDTLCVIDRYPGEDASEPIRHVEIQPGGTAGQAVVAFQRLGGRAAWIGNVGTDGAGQALKKGLEDEGVDTRGVAVVPGVTNFSFVLVSAETGKRNLFSYHDTLPAIDFTLEKVDLIAHARFLHVDTTHKENILPACRIAHTHGVAVSMDGSSLYPGIPLCRELLKLSDILITNRDWPGKITGDGNGERALKEISTWGPKICVRTLGEMGSEAMIGGEIVRFPAYRIRCVDSTGAGDVFHGAFLRAMDIGYDIPRAIRFASAVSAIKCQSVGGRKGIPTKEETLAFIESHDYPMRIV